MSIVHWFKSKTKPRSRIDNCLNILDNFDNKRFSKVFDSNLSVFKLQTLYPNLIEYQRQLEIFYSLLAVDDSIYRIMLPGDVSAIPLYRFFLDSKGCYLNPITDGGDFKESIYKFLSLISDIELKHDKSFNETKNLEFLNDIINNLLSITETINVRL